MAIDPNEIKRLLINNGEMGVNAIAKELDIPVSNLQKYLNRQSYFKKTQNRKWDLPENVSNSLTETSVDNFDSVIESQLTGIDSLFTMLQTQIKATVTLLSAQKPITQPVADKLPKLDRRLYKVQEDANTIKDLFKTKKQDIPEEYRDLVLNFDIIRLMLTEGTNYLKEFVQGEIYELILGKLDKLSEETIKILEENQLD